MRYLIPILLLALTLSCPARRTRPPARQENSPQPVKRTAEPNKALVDQSFAEPQNLGANINEGSAFVAQTYTAGVTGWLTGVNVDVRSKRGLNPEMGFERYSLHVALCEVDNGYPGPILGEVSVKEGEAPLSTLIEFPQRIRQVKGTRYAIVVNYENAPPSGGHQWLGVWAGGTGSIEGGMFFGADGKSWAAAEEGHVLRFRTYVIPD
jgi:hypothetical protein